jgi:hypothetical protein
MKELLKREKRLPARSERAKKPKSNIKNPVSSINSFCPISTKISRNANLRFSIKFLETIMTKGIIIRNITKFRRNMVVIMESGMARTASTVPSPM